MGICSTCSRTFKVDFWEDINHWTSRDESRPEFFICSTCRGSSAIYRLKSVADKSKIPNIKISIIPFYAILENMIRSENHNLSENHLSCIHGQGFWLINANRFSNHCPIKNSANALITRVLKNLYIKTTQR